MARVRYYSPKRRAVYAAGEHIEHLVVFERDNWTCGICHNPIDRFKRFPDPMCATIDHVVEICRALAEGWPLHTIHTYENVQAAHNACNLDKSQSVVLHCDSDERNTLHG